MLYGVSIRHEIKNLKVGFKFAYLLFCDDA